MSEVAPEHRIRGTLGELLPLKYGKSLPAAARDANGSVPVFGSSGVVGQHAASLTSGPTIIVGRKGNVGAVHFSAVPCWPIDTAYFVEPPAGHSATYYRYLLTSLNLVRLDKSTAIPGLSRDDYNAVQVAVHAPAQQLEIVAELEKQFSRLDEAVANLQRVKANLKRYKASVLKAAVEGRLVETEATLARREDRTFETGEQLLQRILEVRRAKWAGRGKFCEPEAPVVGEALSIPDGWCRSTIPQIANIASGNTPAGILDLVKPAGDVPWFKVGDMNHERNQHSMAHADAWLTHQQVEKLGLRVFPPQTVIFPKRGGAIATNKKRLLSSCGACDLNVMGITPFDEVAPYFFLWFESIDLAKLSDGSNIPQINNKDIVPLIVPLPPSAEQYRIVAEVDRHLSIIREVESEVDANLKRAQALRQATLAKAFAPYKTKGETP